MLFQQAELADAEVKQKGAELKEATEARDALLANIHELDKQLQTFARDRSTTEAQLARLERERTGSLGQLSEQEKSSRDLESEWLALRQTALDASDGEELKPTESSNELYEREHELKIMIEEREKE